MRITIETTVSEPAFSMKSVVEVPYDDLHLYDDLLPLIDGVIRGYGFYYNGYLTLTGEEI